MNIPVFIIIYKLLKNTQFTQSIICCNLVIITINISHAINTLRNKLNNNYNE